MEKADVMGRWEVVQWVQEYDDGRRMFPMGEALRGFIRYDENHVTVMIEKGDRTPFSNGQWNSADAEKAAAYNEFMAYSGEYDVQGSQITHIVMHSLFPAWEGGVQKRQAAIEGDLLTLGGRIEDGTPQARTVKLVWRRAR